MTKEKRADIKNLNLPEYIAAEKDPESGLTTFTDTSDPENFSIKNDMEEFDNEPKEKFEVQVNFYSNFENRPASVTPKFVAHKMDFNTPRDFPELIIGGSFEEVMEAAKNKWGDLPHCKITCECPGCTRKEIKYIVPGASELEINNAVSELRKQYPDYDIFVTSDVEDVLSLCTIF